MVGAASSWPAKAGHPRLPLRSAPLRRGWRTMSAMTGRSNNRRTQHGRPYNPLPEVPQEEFRCRLMRRRPAAGGVVDVGDLDRAAGLAVVMAEAHRLVPVERALRIAV